MEFMNDGAIGDGNGGDLVVDAGETAILVVLSSRRRKGKADPLTPGPIDRRA